MASIKPISGFPEWLPEEKLVEEEYLAKIRRTFQRYGFSPVETPAVERVETLVAKGGNEKEIYKIGRLHSASDPTDDADLALHFDLTVPMARYVAQHERELAFPFRRYQIQPVWRGERAQAGRFRQFYQCDIDIVGRESLPIVFDAEIPAIMAEVLRSLAIGDFKISISNRKILQGYLLGLGIEKSKNLPVMRAIDKLDKIGKDGVIAELDDVLDANQEHALPEILNLMSRSISLNEIETLKQISGNEMYREGVDELVFVVAATLMKGVSPKELVVDLSIARGLDYYTGTVFETRLVDYPSVGSVCSGGRYEDLVGSFAKGNYPGVGMSIGLTRLLSQLFKHKVVNPKKQSYTKFFLVPLSADNSVVSYTESFASKLRSWNVPCEVGLIGAKLNKHIEYAEKKGIAHIILIGEEEIAHRVVRVKDLHTREQNDVSITDESFFTGF